ncbi:MAG TPA: hypothetical protein VLU95_03980 [Candidatus Acidoferrum sp.]|nr:hypothetical protein [Candidatus Acidoferrum sp.]
MLERTVSSEINRTYKVVKAAFARKDCKITFEKPPQQILIKQGSLWGTTPKTAKKIVEVNLVSVDSETHLTCSSHLSSDWKNITLIGCFLAAVLVGLCLWMSFDISAFILTRKPSFWSWIITRNGNVDLQVGQAFENLTKILAAFLSVIILLEIAITVYVSPRIDRFAEEILNSLSV